MNIGRNELCHCGSGKKYKKCCLSKAEEVARRGTSEARAAISPPSDSHEHNHEHHCVHCHHPAPGSAMITALEIDPYFEAWDRRWDEFEAADYEEAIALFTRTLNEPPPPKTPSLASMMDDEMAFRMLNELFYQTIEHGERDRFDALTESLRE
jgi:SEC-C motif-containing protein